MNWDIINMLDCYNSDFGNKLIPFYGTMLEYDSEGVNIYKAFYFIDKVRGFGVLGFWGFG